MEPNFQLAEKALPIPLREAIVHVFAQNIQGCVLVGGTAIAGFYAAHRRSDDMDLFTQDAGAQTAAVKAALSLKDMGATLEILQNTPHYFKAFATLSGHSFTIDVVLDAHLFAVGKMTMLPNKIVVADLTTLLKMKSATLVSRCSEKDLFDLIWLLKQVPEASLGDVMDWALEIDAGAVPDSLYNVVAGTILRKEACDFSLDPHVSATDIFKTIRKFQKELAQAFEDTINQKPLPPLGKLFRALK